MGTVYFDENKKPYTHNDFIGGSICEIDDELWAEHAGKNDWDIVNGEFVVYDEATAAYRKSEFYKNFIKTPLGCIRLKTKIGDFMAVLPNLVYKVQLEGKLAADTIVFYQEPDFNNEVTEESLISYKNSEMTTTEFNVFYLEAMAAYQALFNS